MQIMDVDGVSCLLCVFIDQPEVIRQRDGSVLDKQNLLIIDGFSCL